MSDLLPLVTLHIEEKRKRRDTEFGQPRVLAGGGSLEGVGSLEVVCWISRNNYSKINTHSQAASHHEKKTATGNRRLAYEAAGPIAPQVYSSAEIKDFAFPTREKKKKATNQTRSILVDLQNLVNHLERRHTQLCFWG